MAEFTLLTGLDQIEQDPSLIKGLGRIGLVCNQCATTSESFLSAPEIVQQACNSLNDEEVKLVAIFGPQHGYHQTEQDNMIETPDSVYKFLVAKGEPIPLFSLYHRDRRIPSSDQLSQVDTLLVDLLDIGCRVYTYLMTLANCIRAASEHPIRVVVLDRPNPLGLCRRSDTAPHGWTHVEGNALDPEQARSFSGERYPLPYRHGLTLGELGRVFLACDGLAERVRYDVIKVRNLRRATPLSAFAQRPFVLASPNMPTWATSYIYPAMVFLEATNLSEGRGSTLPFLLFGAPGLDTAGLCTFFSTLPAAHALRLRPHSFRPTFSKHVGEVCQGAQLHLTSDAERWEDVHMLSLGLHLLRWIVQRHTEGQTAEGEFAFRWRDPQEGYEYNTTEYAITLMLGDRRWKPVLERGSAADLDALLSWADAEACRFAAQWEHLFLYH